MEEQIITYLSSDKHNYHSLVRLEGMFGKCYDVLLKLEYDGRIERRNSLNGVVFKFKK